MCKEGFPSPEGSRPLDLEAVKRPAKEFVAHMDAIGDAILRTGLRRGYVGEAIHEHPFGLIAGSKRAGLAKRAECGLRLLIRHAGVWRQGLHRLADNLAVLLPDQDPIAPLKVEHIAHGLRDRELKL